MKRTTFIIASAVMALIASCTMTDAPAGKCPRNQERCPQKYCTMTDAPAGKCPRNQERCPQKCCAIEKSNSKELRFESSDKNLELTFLWGEKMALSYAHHGDDAVGCWYEAALPSRNAFCMRDAAHQSIGAEILGLSKHNYNMMSKFAANISESKDWCTYWEIDKDDKPCPADYETDNDFWYNLNANFDVMYACWRLYEWTGDKRYIEDAAFNKFYSLSAKEYVDSWQLNPELL